MKVLSQVLESGVEYGLLDSNPALGKRRRLKAARPSRPWVEPEQLPALLDASSGVGRVLLTLLAGAGLRIGEALSLRWSHVELGTGSLHVVAGKTDAAVRSVDLTHAAREALVLWRAESSFTEPDDFVVPSSTGRRHNPSNLRRDVLRPAVEAANVELDKDGITPIESITFHSLRRTFASLRCACGDDLRYTSTMLGHTDVRFGMNVYAKATRRRERLSGPHLRAYDRALEWARMGNVAADLGTNSGTSDPVAVESLPAETTESPV